jgi:tryptophan synthase beta chain
MDPTKFLLEEREMPERWYNIVADMPNRPLPPLHPGTHQPVGPADLAPLFPEALLRDERRAMDRYPGGGA